MRRVTYLILRGQAGKCDSRKIRQLKSRAKQINSLLPFYFVPNVFTAIRSHLAFKVQTQRNVRRTPTFLISCRKQVFNNRFTNTNTHHHHYPHRSPPPPSSLPTDFFLFLSIYLDINKNSHYTIITHIIYTHLK